MMSSLVVWQTSQVQTYYTGTPERFSFPTGTAPITGVCDNGSIPVSTTLSLRPAAERNESMTENHPTVKAPPTRRDVLMGSAALAAAAALGAAGAGSAHADPPSGNRGENPMSFITTKDGTQI